MHPTQKQAPPVEVTPASTLRAAATYLGRHGWIQGDYYFNLTADLWPAADVDGAIAIVTHGRVCDPDPGLRCWSLPGADMQKSGWTDAHDARAALYDYLVRVGELPTDPVSLLAIREWNDLARQALETVTAALSAAADEWDRTHGGAA